MPEPGQPDLYPEVQEMSDKYMYILHLGSCWNLLASSHLQRLLPFGFAEKQDPSNIFQRQLYWLRARIHSTPQSDMAGSNHCMSSVLWNDNVLHRRCDSRARSHDGGSARPTTESLGCSWEYIFILVAMGNCDGPLSKCFRDGDFREWPLDQTSACEIVRVRFVGGDIGAASKYPALKVRSRVVKDMPPR